jgi:hypothetical protein
MGDTSSATYLREQSERCLRLAGTTTDKDVATTLRDMSAEYLAKAGLSDGKAPSPEIVIGPAPARGH